jgi:flagellar assembly protein FliH
MTQTLHERFGFDTIFAGDGVVTAASPRPKRLYTAEEAEARASEAFAEGERQALSSMQTLQAQALSEIASACSQALGRLAEVAHAHREGSSELALACATAIADAALVQFPRAPLEAALEALAREIEAAPRLVVTVAPELAEGLAETLSVSAQTQGYAGQIVVRPAPGFSTAAFSLDFGDGAAAFDPGQAAQRVAHALQAALASEGLHAEPLIPGSES